MRKYSKIIVIIASYAAFALTALNIALRIPAYTNVIMGCFAAAAAASAAILAFFIINFERERARKERENISRIMQSINAMAILWDADFRFVEVNSLSLIHI